MPDAGPSCLLAPACLSRTSPSQRESVSRARHKLPQSSSAWAPHFQLCFLLATPRATRLRVDPVFPVVPWFSPINARRVLSAGPSCRPLVPTSNESAPSVLLIANFRRKMMRRIRQMGRICLLVGKLHQAWDRRAPGVLPRVLRHLDMWTGALGTRQACAKVPHDGCKNPRSDATNVHDCMTMPAAWRWRTAKMVSLKVVTVVLAAAQNCPRTEGHVDGGATG